MAGHSLTFNLTMALTSVSVIPVVHFAGCVLYELCTLNYPFQASNQAALIMKILKGEYAPVR